MKINEIEYSFNAVWGKNTRTMKEALILESQKYFIYKTNFLKVQKGKKIIVNCWASKSKVRICMTM